MATIGNWLPALVIGAAETAFALTMFVPAYGTAALIMAARRRQLARELADSAAGGHASSPAGTNASNRQAVRERVAS